MNTLIILNTVLGILWAAFSFYVLRKQKKVMDARNRKFEGDIKSLHANQKVLYSSIKDLNNQIHKHEKGQKVNNQTTVIRPNSTI
jgi:uncharacterized protein YlxW (UPF0749 family)